MTVAVVVDLPAQLVIALAFVATAAGTPNRPAALATLPDIVGESRLAPANALLHVVQDIGVVVGPAIGALILATGSPELAFGLNAGTFVWSAVVTMISVRSRGVGGSDGERPPSAIALLAEGLVAMRTTQYVSVMTAMTCFGAFTYGAGTVQLVLYTEERLGQGADGYGYLLGAAGLGGVLAASVSNRLAARSKVALPMVISGVVFCGGALLWAGTSMLWLALLIGVVTGFAMVVSDVVGEVAITRASSPQTRGRIFGAVDGICVGAMVLGALVAPVVIHVAGLRASLVVVGGVTVCLTLACYPTLRGLDRLSGSATAAMAPRLAAMSELGIFRGAPQRALEELAASASEIDVPVGTRVVVQGQPADAFYVDR
ncbi:MAG TPA: MFS transporter [Nocardioidaceae bacterium]|nr:MFS transporter [Nocardioidaceae bacterium]